MKHHVPVFVGLLVLALACSEPPKDGGVGNHRPSDSVQSDAGSVPDISKGVDVPDGNRPDASLGVDASIGGGGDTTSDQDLDDGGDGCPMGGAKPVVFVGPAGFTTLPLAPGDAIPLKFGSEGGASTVFNLITIDAYALVTEVRSVLTTADGTIIGDETSHDVVFLCQSDGARLVPNFTVGFLNSVDMVDHLDAALTLQVQLRLNSGESLQAVHTGPLELSFE